MATKAKRKPTVRIQPTREHVLACTRHILATIAYWTGLLFDEGGPKRLAGAGLSLWSAPLACEIAHFDRPKSAGIHTETSTTLHAMAKAFDFVDSGVWSGTSDQLDAFCRDLEPILALMNTGALVDQMETLLLNPDAERVVRDIILKMWARKALDVGQGIDLPQLARLSGLTEKTIRMAAIHRKRGAQDIPTYKEGTRTWVKASDALRWLSKRTQFKPTQIRGPGSVIDLEPKTALQLARLLEALRTKTGLSQETVAAQIGLTAAQVSSYTELEGGWWSEELPDVSLFDVPRLNKLARVLRVKSELSFVRAVGNLLAPYQMEAQLRRLQTAPAKKPARKR